MDEEAVCPLWSSTATTFSLRIGGKRIVAVRARNLPFGQMGILPDFLRDYVP